MLILLILLLAAFLRLNSLNEPGLWLDEAAYTIAAQKPIIAQIVTPIKTLRDSIGAADPVLSAIPFSLALKLGFSNYLARFPAAVAGILSIAVMYRLGRDLFGYTIGLIGALLLCTSSFHLLYSQEARSYSQLTLFTLFSFWFLYRATTRHRLADWTMYTLAVWAGISSHYDMAFVVFTHGVFLLLAPFLQRAWTQPLWIDKQVLQNWGIFLTAMVIVFLARLPWLTDFLYWSERTVGGPYTLQLRDNFIQSVQTMLSVRPGILTLYAGLGITGLSFAFYRSRRAALLLTVWLVLSIPTTIVGLWYVSQFFHPRHIIWSLPAFLLTTACSAVALPHLLQQIWPISLSAPIQRSLIGLAIAPLLVVNLVQAQQISQMKQNWPLGRLEEATHYIATQAQPYEVVIGVPNAQYLQLYIEPIRQDLIYLDTRNTTLPDKFEGAWYVFYDIRHIPATGQNRSDYRQFHDLLVVHRPDTCTIDACLNEMQNLFTEVVEANPDSPGVEKIKIILSGLSHLKTRN